MKTEAVNEAKDHPKDHKTITVILNEHPVNFSEHKVTGLEIKQTAIHQGVAIQPDFVLFEVKGDAPLKQIGDAEVLTLHKGQIFRAVAPDDNS